MLGLTPSTNKLLMDSEPPPKKPKKNFFKKNVKNQFQQNVDLGIARNWSDCLLLLENRASFFYSWRIKKWHY